MAHAICTFLLFASHFLYLCLGRDTIRIGEWIHDRNDDKIVSAGNIFQLGFFRPSGKAHGKYVGIWYCDSPEVIVWVANREFPIPFNGSGTFGIDIKSGNLEVSDRGSTKFSTNIANSPKSQPTAKLMHTGNLVLTAGGAILWESFKHPTDTFLQGMKMDENLNLTSWTSDEDPAPGKFSFRPDEKVQGGESADSFIPKQTIDISDALLYLSGTKRTTSKGNVYCNNVSCSNVFDSYTRSRLLMRSNGEIEYLTWDLRNKSWSVFLTETPGPCSVHNACGSFGRCNPDSNILCDCLPGYGPVNGDEWKSNKFSGGCRKIKKCQRDNTTSFELLLVKMVRSNTPYFNNSISEDDCKLACQHDCTCQAYSYRKNNTDYKRNPTASSRCWLWFDDLIHIQKGTDGDHSINFRSDPEAPNIDQGLSPPTTGNQQRIKNFPTLRGVIIATSVIFAVTLLCSITLISYRRVMAKGKARNIKENQTLRLYDNKYLMDRDDQLGEDDKKDIDVPFFELESILAATDNFSQAHKLGQGGFGPVYKGKFPGGEEIAVKRLSSTSGQGLVEFKNEVVLIAKLQHRNLVRLLGYCIKGNERILLYEYMPNRSLDALIFDEKSRLLLNWATRFDIILGVARGLLYLHQDSRLRIIHRDMKASNILLDEEMNPKISDFGLARIVGRRETEYNTTRVMGTYGYMAPEYAVEGLFSIKSDAFSFGVVVLEIISGKKNTGFFDSQLALSLLGYAWSLWKEEKAMTLLDETLVGACNEREVLKCIAVGLLCVQEDPDDRPNMSKVVTMLSSEMETFPNPKQPAFVSRKRFYGSSSSSSTRPETQSRNEITFSQVDGR